jgi:hypothetical protein
MVAAALVAQAVQRADSIMSTFRDELQALINRYSKENGSDTPDFILASYLEQCLKAFDQATKDRDAWYGQITMTRLNAGVDPPSNRGAGGIAAKTAVKGVRPAAWSNSAKGPES